LGAPFAGLLLVATTARVTSAQGAAQPAASRPVVGQSVVGQSVVGQSAQSGVRSGLVVRPDTVAVGDPFTLMVTVVVPASARIEWPTVDDSAAVVAMRSPVRVTSVPGSDTRRETAVYTLAAWDVGLLPIGIPNPTVRYGTTSIRVPIEAARVFVRSVLPGDTSLHVPKPGKGLFPRVVPWWERWWPAAAVIAGLLLLWWIYRRMRRKPAVRAAPPVDVFARAIHDFERLDRLSLTDAGERGRAVALAVEILRSYLVARNQKAALSLTSIELLDVTAEDDRVPNDRLGMLLWEADAIKFARRVVQGARTRDLTAEARAIVEGVEEAQRARIAAEQERRARERRDAEDAKKQNEDDARRRSRRKAGAA